MPFPSSSSATGIWSLKRQGRAQQGSNWPTNLQFELFAWGGGGV